MQTVYKHTTQKLQKRINAFIFGCMVARLGVVFLAYKYSQTLSQELSWFAGILSIGFLTIYAFGLRTTGVEVLGDKIWWNHLRPVHGVLWGIFAYYIAYKNKNSYMVLGVDTLLGLLAFLNFHNFI